MTRNEKNRQAGTAGFKSSELNTEWCPDQTLEVNLDCYRWSICGCPPPPRIHMLRPNPHGMVFGGGPLEGEEAGRVGPPCMGLVPAYGRFQRALSCLLPRELVRSPLCTRKRVSPDTKSVGALILNFQPPEVWEIHFHCF